MRRFLAAAAILGALSLPAHAVILQATDVGASGTTTIQGFVDINGTAVQIPGLTASLFLEYDGVTNGGLTWNFDYTITNTSSGNVATSRISSFGFALTPDPTGATSTGLYGTAILDPNFPNVGGAGNLIDVCYGAGGGCSSGAGLLPGQTASGEFTLSFDSVLSSINLQYAFARFQSIDSDAFGLQGGSGVGINNDVNITPFAVPGPIVGAGLPGLIVGCLTLMGLARRRRKAALA